MMVYTTKEVDIKKVYFEDAMNHTGFGKYSIAVLITCCLLIITMYLDIFAFSVVLPAVACDMDLTTTQQGLLSAIPLIGVMMSSYAWGLCTDTIGRRTTLLLAMPIGVFFNLATSVAPNYAALAALKFISASFSSSANAAGFVLLGESIPSKYRSRFMFYMVMATMMTQGLICVFALPIFQQSFSIEVSWLAMVYRPWRLLLQVLSIPGAIGCICVTFLKESPKYLLCKNKEKECLVTLRFMFKLNTGKGLNNFPVESVYLEEQSGVSQTSSFLKKMWSHTAPLFQPPLLKNSVMLYYLLLCAFMTSTGFTMWVPTISNYYFSGDDDTGYTFCEVATSAASNSNTTTTDCDNTIQTTTLYAVMVYSGLSCACTLALSFIVISLGKKKSTILVFMVSILCGLLLLFITIPMMSVALFYMFLAIAVMLGNINTYLVELNPTHLRGMATCLSVVVARGFGFMSVQLIGNLIGSYCTPMLSGYLLLVISGLFVSFFLPSDKRASNESNMEDSSTEVDREAKNISQYR